MDWSDVLRDAIRDSGKTTYAIAQESQVPVQTVDRIMGGQEPKLCTAQKLGSVVGLTLTRIKPTKRRSPRSA